MFNVNWNDTFFQYFFGKNSLPELEFLKYRFINNYLDTLSRAGHEYCCQSGENSDSYSMYKIQII